MSEGAVVSWGYTINTLTKFGNMIKKTVSKLYSIFDRLVTITFWLPNSTQTP